MTRTSRSVVLLVLLLTSSRLLAHDVPVEAVVAIDVAPAAGVLNVTVNMPLVALADANLPRNEDRQLAHPAVDEVLRAVARDVAGRLEFRQAGSLLGEPAATATVAGDGQSVDFALVYRIAADPRELSARLQAYRSGLRQLTTIARYHDPGGATRTFTVSAGPETIVFEPAIPAVIQRFVKSAVQLALGGGDYLLFLVCLAVPARSIGRLHPAAIAFFVSQGLTTVLVSLVRPAAAGSSAALAIGALAASAIVVTALQNLLAPESPRVTLLAMAFGLFSGYGDAATFHALSPFAGDHIAVGLDTFALATAFTELWGLALAAVVLRLAVDRGVPGRWLTVGVSAYIAHNALHRVANRLQFPDSGSWTLDQFGLLLVSGWIVAILAVGIADALRTGRGSVRGPAGGSRA